MNSQAQTRQDSYINQLNSDIEFLSGWVEDTLQPSIDLLKLKVSIRSLLQDVCNHEILKGETDRTRESKNKFDNMLYLCEKLDKIATQNNTFQLIVKHSQMQLSSAKLEIKVLKSKLESFEKAWNEL